jgi:hypothetical protein
MSILGLLAVIARIGWNAGGRLRAMGRVLDGVPAGRARWSRDVAGYLTAPVQCGEVGRGPA